MTVIKTGWIGAQSSAKTTTVNRVHAFLKSQGKEVVLVPETARLYKGKIGRQGGFSAQLWMIQEQMRRENKAHQDLAHYEDLPNEAHILCDRTIWDMLVYSVSLNKSGLIKDNELDIIKDTVLNWIEVMVPYDSIFFCEKKLIYDDGKRDPSPEWQDNIYKTFKTVIKEYNIPAITVQ